MNGGMWVRIDPWMFMDDKMDKISGDALKLWLAALCTCNQLLGENSTERDGIVTRRMIEHMQVDLKIADIDTVISELVDRVLWANDEDDTYIIVNYSKYQKTWEQVEREKREKARSVALHRSGNLRDLIKTRDQNKCRFCGIAVSWNDRRSKGATYVYIDPRGMNTLDNVVVACRDCQNKKGSKTLKRAHMELLPPPGGDGPGGIWNGSSSYSDTGVRAELSPRFDNISMPGGGRSAAAKIDYIREGRRIS